MATNNSVNTGLAGQTGTGSFVGSASPTFTGTPVLATPSATSLTFSSTSGIIGTTTNNNAAAGSVGELISSLVPLASAISISTNTATNVTSISLTAGDWDVYGNVGFNPTLLLASVDTWTSATSATLPDVSLISAITAPLTSGGLQNLPTPFARYSLAGTTTIYLQAFTTITSGTCTVFGNIFARRVR